MRIERNLPLTEIDLSDPDSKVDSVDMLADYFELLAFFSSDSISFPENFEDEYESHEDELEYDEYGSEEKDKYANDDGLLDEVERKIIERKHILQDTYPFIVDSDSEMLTFKKEGLTCGQVAYILSLLLSNICESSDKYSSRILLGTSDEIGKLQTYFECFGVAAMASEVCGKVLAASSLIFDGSTDFNELENVARTLESMKFYPNNYSPGCQDDGGLYVFAARLYSDGLPGCSAALAQVVTGKNWEDKAARGASEVMSMWLSKEKLIITRNYSIIPFAKSKGHEFERWIYQYGQILHRMRLPLRVEQALSDREEDIPVEVVKQIDNARTWVMSHSADE